MEGALKTHCCALAVIFFEEMNSVILRSYEKDIHCTTLSFKRCGLDVTRTVISSQGSVTKWVATVLLLKMTKYAGPMLIYQKKSITYEQRNEMEKIADDAPTMKMQQTSSSKFSTYGDRVSKRTW